MKRVLVTVLYRPAAVHQSDYTHRWITSGARHDPSISGAVACHFVARHRP